MFNLRTFPLSAGFRLRAYAKYENATKHSWTITAEELNEARFVGPVYETRNHGRQQEQATGVLKRKVEVPIAKEIF